MVEIEARNGQIEVYRLQKISAADGKMTFRKHNSADITDNATRFIASPNTLRARKLSVDVLGHAARSSHD
jgi:hypothetical protein